MTKHSLFSLIDPYHTDHFETGDGHHVYYELSANPRGLPVLILHGGPASGSSPQHRRFFSADRFHMIQFDQRGCGRSLPSGEQTANNTSKLIDDIEQLRERLSIERWLVHGGSWGSALAVAYAGRYPERCSGLLLRGIFLASESDLHWYFVAARELLPDAWNQFAEPVSTQMGVDPEDMNRVSLTAQQMIGGYMSLLQDANSSLAQSAASSYQLWERALGSVIGSSDSAPQAINTTLQATVSIALCRKYQLQLHYLNERCQLGENELLAAASRIGNIPVALLHGRQDLICRPGNARKLANAVQRAQLVWIDNCGHDPFSLGMVSQTIAASSRFAADGHFDNWNR